MAVTQRAIGLTDIGRPLAPGRVWRAIHEGREAR